MVKMYAYWITANYRETYGMFTSNSILFNDESLWRDQTIGTRKIASRIALGRQDCQYPGHMSALDDWGHEGDYFEMKRRRHQDKAENFVIAFAVQDSVRQLVEFAALGVGTTQAWLGKGTDKTDTVSTVIGKDMRCKLGEVVVKVDLRSYRPIEIGQLLYLRPQRVSR